MIQARKSPAAILTSKNFLLWETLNLLDQLKH